MKSFDTSLPDWKEKFLETTFIKYEEGHWIVDENKIQNLTECLQAMLPFGDIPTLKISLGEIQKGIVLLSIENREFVPRESLRILREFNNVLKRTSRESSEFHVRKYPDVKDSSLVVAIHLRLPCRTVKNGKLTLHITEVTQAETTFWKVYEYVKHVWQDTICDKLEMWNRERQNGKRFS
jgi:hypothetical protein